MNIYELRRAKGDAFSEMENISLTAEGRTMTAAEIARWESFREKYDRAVGAIDVLDPQGKTAPVDMRDLVPDIYGSQSAHDSLTDKRTTAGIPVLRPEQRMSALPTFVVHRRSLRSISTRSSAHPSPAIGLRCLPRSAP